MTRRYGVPYKGSKSKLAERIVDVFPQKTNFYDLFCGGGAITHRALITGKFQNYYINDIQPKLADTIKQVLSNDYEADTSWVSRDDFFRRYKEEPLIKVCWSFGNDGHSYLYSKEIEQWKKALHYARVYKDYSLLREFGIDSDGSRKDIREHKEEYKQKYIVWYMERHGFTDEEKSLYKELKGKGVFDNLGAVGACGKIKLKKRIESIRKIDMQSLERLESLESLESSQKSYDEIEIKANSVIYCDIPYRGTTGYGTKELDYDKFFDWCRKQKELVFVSSYEMPDDFVPVAEFSHRSTINDSKNLAVVEKIFIPKQQIALYNAVKPNRDLFDEVA